MRNGYAQRIDSNQKEIVKALRGVGAYVVPVHSVKEFCDIVVAYKSNTYIVEIKDGSKPPSQKRLTPGELKCKEGFNNVGVEYHVIESVDEALELLKIK